MRTRPLHLPVPEEPRAGLPRPVGPSSWFIPDPDEAGDPSGLVGLGADLAVETLVDAYRRGIFPWPHEASGMLRRRSKILPWFSPDPRAVIFPGQVHVSRSLRRTLRRSGWETTVDSQFEAVVTACSQRPGGEPTWITDDMRVAYCRLFRSGWAHSVEVWEGDRLVGGIYGVRVGACLTGESMFHRATDASKVALVDLVERWSEAGGHMVDVQLPTDHLCRLGAVEMPREQFLSLLAAARDRQVCMVLDRKPVSRLGG